MPLTQDHGAQHHADHPPCSGVHADTPGGSDGARQEELISRRILIHGLADMIPEGGFQLPFVEQQRFWQVTDDRGVGGDGLALSRVQEAQHSGRTLLRRRCLPHSLGPLEGHGRQVRQQLIKVVVHDPAHVFHDPIEPLAEVLLSNWSGSC